ncbi:MAG: hypothetical protein Q9227_004358 [Pyrenula ochraceoflavens]
MGGTMVHGFPDLSAAWRYQIPMLLELGLRVVAPDCMGYGRTGGMVVYRMAEYYPTLVSHLFSLCTPYLAPQATYVPLHTLVTKFLPNFTYQLDFASGALEEHLLTPASIRGFLNGAYGARGPKGETLVSRNGPVRVEAVTALAAPDVKNPLTSDRELEFYVSEFSRHGLAGPLTWYRTRETNFINDLALVDQATGKQKKKIAQPTLFVVAQKDMALPESMSEGMEKYFVEGGLRRGKVDGGHWAMWENGGEVINGLVRKWFEEVVFGGKTGAKL